MPSIRLRDRRAEVVAAVLVLLFAALGARAQLASLTADLNPDLESDGSAFGPLLQLNGRLLFPAAELSLGGELWATDGTAAGTRLLADSCRGQCSMGSSIPPLKGQDLVYWVGGNGVGATPLWRSDGAPRGTFQVNPADQSDVRPGAVIAGDRLVFTAMTPETGTEPWGSDGTPEGTVLLRDIDPGPISSAPEAIHSLGSIALFLALDGNRNWGLWRTDATPEGTWMVRDFGDLRALLRFSAVAGGQMFFGLRNPLQTELWVSDGTAAGTRRVRAFAGGRLERLAALGHRVVFTVSELSGAGGELWVSDGTAGGTRRISELVNPFPFAGLVEGSVAGLPGRILFVARDASEESVLWATDGTPSHTERLASVCGDSCDSPRVRRRLETLGSRVFFVGRDVAHGHEVWTSDGTAAGTHVLFDVCPGACGEVSDLEVVGDQLYFVAFDLDHGYQLWQSDGTAAGTRRLTRFGDGPAEEPGVFLLGPEAALGEAVYFAARDSLHGTQLWKHTADGSLSALTRLRASGAGSDPGPVLDVAGRAVFHGCARSDARALWSTQGPATDAVRLTADGSFDDCDFTSHIVLGQAAGLAYFVPVVDSPPFTLWRTDGTPEGNRPLVELSVDSFSRDFIDFVEVGGQAYFAQALGDRVELWRSDGTPEGTLPAATVPTPPELFGLRGFSSLGEEVFFLTIPFDGPLRIWRSDGTEGGTVQLAELPERNAFSIGPQFTRAGELVFFAAPEADMGSELWKTDGTPEGTGVVRDVRPGSSSSRPRFLTALGDRLAFFAEHDEDAVGLWMSDGTEAGTTLLRGFVGIDSGSGGPPVQPVALGGQLLFAADDGALGHELWVSDGTPGGTRLLEDIHPGRGSSRVGGFLRAGDRVYFSADDGVHGEELWVTDGTAEGTRLVHDLAPGAVSSSPRELSVAGGRLYFAADDGLAGRELWSLDLAAPAGSCTDAPSALCLQGERFRVEMGWRDFRDRTGRATPEALSSDTGYFWFFDPANVETIVKVLDGRPLNDHFWSFYGALSNVEYTMTVTDAETGVGRRYFNPLGNFASVGDVRAFGPRGASLDGHTPVPDWVYQQGEPADPVLGRGAATGPCEPSPTRLCLQGDRFAVEATWRTPNGNQGVGTAVPLTADTGTFWFFDDANVEVVVKALDGRPVNGNFWVFYGSLSNVEYTLTVTDTETGRMEIYENPAGRFASVGDTGAFPGD